MGLILTLVLGEGSVKWRSYEGTATSIGAVTFMDDVIYTYFLNRGSRRGVQDRRFGFACSIEPCWQKLRTDGIDGPRLAAYPGYRIRPPAADIPGR